MSVTSMPSEDKKLVAVPLYSLRDRLGLGLLSWLVASVFGASGPCCVKLQFAVARFVCGHINCSVDEGDLVTAIVL